jgi:hypothetical protein
MGPQTSKARLLLPPSAPLPLQQGDVDIHVQLGSGPGQLALSGTTLGKGSWGRVVAGTYLGQPVAVKLLDRGLLEAALGQPMAGNGEGAGALRKGDCRCPCRCRPVRARTRGLRRCCACERHRLVLRRGSLQAARPMSRAQLPATRTRRACPC